MADLFETANVGNRCPRCQLEVTPDLPEEALDDATNDARRPSGHRNKRIAISKADRETAIGLELLSLCQTITEDGRILDDEVNGLQAWLEENKHVDLPAIEALRVCVSEILADRVISDAERLQLQKLIERILPPDLRSYAVLKRRQLSDEAKAAAAEVRKQARLAREENREDRERDQAVERFDFMVAGVAYEGRGPVIARHAHEGMTAYLIRDRANRYSPNAIEVRLRNGTHIGYVPEESAVELAPYFDSGCRSSATIKRLLTKTRTGYPIPVIKGDIFGADARVPGAVSEAEVPAKRHPSQDLGLGCGGCALALVAVLLLILLVLGR
jgi:hypothetical protein